MTTTTPQRTRYPTAAERFEEAAPEIGAPAIYGPPVIFVLGPWLFLVLLLIPPAAFLITLGLVVVLAAGVLAALGALIASPYLLVRHLRTRQPADRRESAPPPRPVRQSVGARLAHLATR